MDEKKLMALVNVGTVVLILVLAGAFTAVIRASLQAVGGH